MYQKSKNMLLGYYFVIFAVLFYSTGNFGLINLFDFRREFQVIIFLILSPLFLNAFTNWRLRYIAEPLLILAIVVLIGEIALRQRLIHIADNLVAIIILVTLFSLNEREHNKILKCIILLSAIFSVMVIIQAIIVWFYPGVIDHFGMNYKSGTSIAKVDVGHPLEYLGFTVHYRGFYLFGHYFIRFMSFASEPSYLAYSFLMPGLLALTYKGFFKICAAPILFFVILLSGSGTIWLSVVIGLSLLPVLLLLKRNRRVRLLLPFILIILIFLFLSSLNVGKFASKVISTLSPFAGIHSEIIHKRGSITKRLSSAQEYMALIKKDPMGLKYSRSAPVGLFFIWYHEAGIFGILIGSVVAFRIFSYSLHALYVTRGFVCFGSGMIYGVFLVVLFFFGAKWDTFHGFILLFLTISRLKQLAAPSLEKERSLRKISWNFSPFFSRKKYDGVVKSRSL